MLSHIISLLFICTGKVSESENKSLVTAIHKLKEGLKLETEKLKALKQQLMDVQERQNMEKQGAKAQMSSAKGTAELRQKVEVFMLYYMRYLDCRIQKYLKIYPYIDLNNFLQEHGQHCPHNRSVKLIFRVKQIPGQTLLVP